MRGEGVSQAVVGRDGSAEVADEVERTEDAGARADLIYELGEVLEEKLTDPEFNDDLSFDYHRLADRGCSPRNVGFKTTRRSCGHRNSLSRWFWSAGCACQGPRRLFFGFSTIPHNSALPPPGARQPFNRNPISGKTQESKGSYGGQRTTLPAFGSSSQCRRRLDRKSTRLNSSHRT